MGTGAALYEPASKNFPSIITAIGMIRPFLPLAGSCISASARGPLTAAALCPYCGTGCARPGELATQIAAAQMTAIIPLRYNLRYNNRPDNRPNNARRGENPMEVNDKSPDFSTT